MLKISTSIGLLIVFVAIAESASLAASINNWANDFTSAIRSNVADTIQQSLTPTIQNLESRIAAIDSRTYDIPTTFTMNGRRIRFNGSYFTRGRNGPRLDQAETEQAWAALRRSYMRALSSVQGGYGRFAALGPAMISSYGGAPAMISSLGTPGSLSMIAG
ncbi:unnamed protein product [Brachionus calyciflorus]|uniref:Uncharacterized protein n=1 Tax=Brachionus calyciflorus TaxID=104777 RepID=A0A813M5R6_9BILA|nr:unnamed protein product [Brachionus calyciflorus]